MTLLIVINISKLRLKLDAFHPDGVGGVGCVGELIIRTTMLFSTGALFLPIIYQVGKYGSVAFPYIVFLAVCFSSFSLVSFLVPSFIIYRAANRQKESILNDLRHRYRKARFAIEGGKARTRRMYTALEVMCIMDEYRAYARLRVFPINLNILVQVVYSVIIPFVLLLIDHFML